MNKEPNRSSWTSTLLLSMQNIKETLSGNPLHFETKRNEKKYVISHYLSSLVNILIKAYPQERSVMACTLLVCVHVWENTGMSAWILALSFIYSFPLLLRGHFSSLSSRVRAKLILRRAANTTQAPGSKSSLTALAPDRAVQHKLTVIRQASDWGEDKGWSTITWL